MEKEKLLVLLGEAAATEIEDVADIIYSKEAELVQFTLITHSGFKFTVTINCTS